MPLLLKKAIFRRTVPSIPAPSSSHPPGIAHANQVVAAMLSTNWKPSLIAPHKPALARPANRPGPAEVFLDVDPGFMRVPTAFLSVKVDIGTRLLPFRYSVLVLRSVALERGQRLDQSAIHAEVSLGQQASSLGLTDATNITKQTRPDAALSLRKTLLSAWFDLFQFRGFAGMFRNRSPGVGQKKASTSRGLCSFVSIHRACGNVRHRTS